MGTPDSPHHLTLGGETTTLRPLFLSALGDLCASREWRIDVSHVPIVTALVQGVVRPVPPLCGVTPARRTPPHPGRALVFSVSPPPGASRAEDDDWGCCWRRCFQRVLPALPLLGAFLQVG